MPTRPNLPGILIEIKASKKSDENELELLARQALDQIEVKKYDIELVNHWSKISLKSVHLWW